MKKKLTKADLKKTLGSLGFKEGDELIIPSEKDKANESAETNDEGEGEDDEGDGNGGNHPPKKGSN